jgi:peptidyl-tRNA hydrolase, PTH1 family
VALMKLICGLGNPGREYERHRHNIGFMVVDALLARAKAQLTQEKFDGRVGQGTLGGEKVLFLQPQTFMNLSGQSLAAAARFYKVDLADTLVIHDELDLPFGRLQLKSGGGAGGHNGLKSIIEHFGDAFPRLRFGIGKPEGPNARERVSGHVLSNFSGEEQSTLGELITRAVEMAEVWTREGLGPAMNRFNRR